MDTKIRERMRKFYNVIIDFDEDKAYKLKEFIEESRRLAKISEVPEEVKKVEHEEEEEEE